jgi:outer membrane protein
MSRSRIILLVFTAALVAGLYFMPKVVVDNEKNVDVVTAEEHSPDDGHDHEGDHEGHAHAEEEEAEVGQVASFHARELNAEESKQANSLKENIKNSTDNEKSAKFANSLTELYLSANQLDSAMKYSALAAKEMPGMTYWKKAGDVHYKAFQYATEESELTPLAVKVREYYDKVLEKEPDNLTVKTNVAMTYIPTSNPMKGIMMLREVLEADPNNQEALFNMGVLSLQSGQHQKAAERFEKLVELNPDHMQAHLYLGVAYMSLGQNEQAREQFETVKKLDDDPQVQAIADSYLEELN